MHCTHPVVAVWYKPEFAASRPLMGESVRAAYGFEIVSPRLLSGYVERIDALTIPSNALKLPKVVDDFCEFILLPCGRCLACRLNKSSEWVFRNYQEHLAHDEQSRFLTLTFEDEGLNVLPRVGDRVSLAYEPFQLFLKRLRKAIGSPVRFFMCGEYGDKFGRPHYHCLLYGWTFPDAYFFKMINDVPYYRSPMLERCWPYGFSLIGETCLENIKYVSRYAVKKVTGLAKMAHYQGVMPEFVRMSLKPGIGSLYYDEFFGKDFCVAGSDGTFSRDFVRLDGHKMRVPRFYDKKAQREHFRHYAMLKDYRFSRMDDPFEVSGTEFVREDEYLNIVCKHASKKGLNHV